MFNQWVSMPSIALIVPEPLWKLSSKSFWIWIFTNVISKQSASNKMSKSFDWQLKLTLKKQESNTWFSTEIKMDMLHKLPNNKLLIPSCAKWMASSITEMLNTSIWTKRNRPTLLNYLWVKSWITWKRNYKSKKSKTNKYRWNLIKHWNKRKYTDPGLTS